MADLTGHDLGRYHLTERLGEGGMATVYKAYDTRLETDVAVKVIRTENLAPSVYERSIKRFTREAKALARLTHPNIVKVTDYGEYDGKPYLVMPYLPGGTLKQRLGKPMPWKEAVKLLLPIAEALDFAHSQNMIHRDVKPSNILLTERGQPMLGDFGIAKILDLEETADLTGTGMGIGTPEYMAPEQWTGKTSTQSDQYALGVVLYEMLTGRKPYTADTPAAILLKQATEPLLRPSQFARDLPEKVEKLLLKALAKNPVDRYPSMGDLASAMETLLTVTAAPEKKQPERPRGRAVETLTDVEPELVEPTIKQSFAPQARSTQTVAPAASPGILRYWPIGVGILIIIGLTGALLNALTRDRVLHTATPPPVTEARITTEVPFVTEAPMKTEVPAVTEISVVQDEITDSQGVVMRLVPAGEFTMGSENGDSDGKPVHQVYVDAFYMDKYEVTNALYQACVDAGMCDPPHETSSYTRSSYYGNSQYSDYPVIKVDWNQANAYCGWRGARLPTEAEWEKAARGTDGRTYPWGNDFQCRNGNFDDETQIDIYVVPGGTNCDGYVDTAPVGSYASGKSPYGIFDMAGNVLEWVSSLYQSYPYNATDGREDLNASGSRVLRGGTWIGSDYVARSLYRFWLLPVSWGYSIGFRCVRSE